MKAALGHEIDQRPNAAQIDVLVHPQQAVDVELVLGTASADREHLQSDQLLRPRDWDDARGRDLDRLRTLDNFVLDAAAGREQIDGDTVGSDRANGGDSTDL